MQKPKINTTFRVIQLPLICRVYLNYRNSGTSSGPLGRLKSFLWGRLFRIMLRIPLTQRDGVMEVNVKGRIRRATFNGNNLQFRALYMPVYQSGYENATVSLVTALMQNETVLFDIGSNWGYFSICAAAASGFHGSVYAFEPNPVAREDLVRILSQTGLDNVVTVQPFGLGSQASSRGISSESLTHTGRTQLTDDSDNVVKVEIKRLDDLVIPRPDIIKVDAEGMELEILKGALSLLKNCSPLLIFESWADLRNPFETVPLFRFLESLDYEFYVPSLTFRSDQGIVDVQMDETCTAMANAGQPGVLSLVKLEPRMRPLLQTHLNLVACHKTKIAVVKEHLHVFANI